MKPAEELLDELSFLSKKQLPTECDNFSYIDELLEDTRTEEACEPHLTTIEPVGIKHEEDITPKTDSGRGGDEDDDDKASSHSSQSWQVGVDDDEDYYDERFDKLSQSMKILEKQFEHDLRPFVHNEKLN